jgi:tetratricopeptide (TPR) repeat protein
MDIGKKGFKMRTRANIKTFIYILMLFFPLFSTFCKQLFGNDKVLDYALELLKDQKVEIQYDEKGKLVSISNGAVDSDYKEIAKAYFRLGYQEKSIQLFKKITLEESRYDVLKVLIQSKVEMKNEVRSSIKNKIESLKDKLQQIYLYKEFIIDCLEDGKQKKAVEIFHKRNKLIQSIKGPDNDYAFVIGDSLSMVFPLIENGLEVLADKLLKDVENYISKQPDFEIMGVLLEKNISLNKKDKINELLKKMKVNAKDDAKKLYDLAVFLLRIEMYKEADELLVAAFSLFNDNGKKEETIMNLADFVASNNILETPVVLNLVGNNREIREIIEKSLVTKEKSRMEELRGYEFLGMNDKIIEFFVKTGYYEKAWALAQKLDKVYNTSNHRDYYYYQLGLVYEKSFDTSAMVLMAEKIKMRSLAIDMLLRAAKYYSRSYELTKFRRVMDKATKLLSREKKDNFIPGDVGDVVLAWLAAGFFNEANTVIEYEKDRETRSMLLFELAQELILQNRLTRAIEMIEEISVKDYKALLFSKIAARCMIIGREKEGVEYFKKAVQIVIMNKNGFLSYILRDYVDAKLHKIINRTESWKGRYVVR